jgi:hypothetical protein
MDERNDRDERNDDRRAQSPIDEDALPQAGNSDARLYPPADEAGESEGAGDDAPGQAEHGDAAAVREGEDQQGRQE